MPAATAKPRPAASRIARPTRRTKAPVPTVDDLANDVAAKLSISDPKTKGKAKAVPQCSAISTEARSRNAMQAVNAVSKKLASALDENTSIGSRREVETWATSARDGLRELRKLGSAGTDTERAASSIAGKLITLEMVCLYPSR